MGSQGKEELFEDLAHLTQDSGIYDLQRILLREMPLHNLLFSLAQRRIEHKELLTSPETIRFLRPWFSQIYQEGRDLEEVGEELISKIDLSKDIFSDRFKTSFFRYPGDFKKFEEYLLKNLKEKARIGKREVRIWSAGCATGQEPYSLAIMLYRLFEHNAGDLGEISDWQIEIVGTDRNLYVLRYAQQAEYDKFELMERQERLKHYGYSLEECFEPVLDRPTPEIYKIKDEIKRWVRFEYLNIEERLQRERMKDFDAVFCRNVYPYFSSD